MGSMKPKTTAQLQKQRKQRCKEGPFVEHEVDGILTVHG